jgi:hypothetical protein
MFCKTESALFSQDEDLITCRFRAEAMFALGFFFFLWDYQ